MEQKAVIIPRIDFDQRLYGSNVFADVFGDLSPEEWLETLISSIETSAIEGVDLPSFPPIELQNSIHGASGAVSLRGAHNFYSWMRARNLAGPSAPWFGKGHMLDFGSGWGRILRLFMRDFPLKNIVGFEPNNLFCSIARANNPFVSFISGEFTPPTLLGNNRFDLIVGWSIFSHLSEESATDWLIEFSRLLAPGGAIVMTTWGLRFLERLRREEAQLHSGEDIHFYSKVCLKGSGDLNIRIKEYNQGQFVWFHTGHSKLYGEAFLGEKALQRILDTNRINLSIEVFDNSQLAQDVFVLRSTKV